MAWRRTQAAVGAGVLLLGLGLAGGAVGIPGEAGYGGVGPNFLPWVLAAALVLCGGLLLREAASGGYRELEVDHAEVPAHWGGFAWVSAGLLANAALITQIGFILSCALCFALAAQGFKLVEDRVPATAVGRLRQLVVDAAVGAAIAAPVYWMFTQLLAINLPGLTATGWI
jgi:putative tricarboxylic transport membrane protein